MPDWEVSVTESDGAETTSSAAAAAATTTTSSACCRYAACASIAEPADTNPRAHGQRAYSAAAAPAQGCTTRECGCRLEPQCATGARNSTFPSARQCGSWSEQDHRNIVRAFITVGRPAHEWVRPAAWWSCGMS